ncbi:MAG TPA: hypothetical protein VIL56_02130 [Gaiellaceae bacterium]
MRRLATWAIVVAAATLLVASPADSSHGTLAREPITVPAGTTVRRDEVESTPRTIWPVSGTAKHP